MRHHCTGAEHQRLIRQARLLAPFTERFFRDAGVTAGMRVLDIGCGIGDVSMIVAELVGTSGSVSPSSRIGPKARIGGVLDQRLSLKGLHYMDAGWARAAAVILGGGCDGKVSLSWLIRSCSSGSGWV